MTALQLQYQATHDHLTGLRNRSCLEQELLDAMTRCDENPRRQLAVVAIDLNDFKHINDSHGHAAGDHLLQNIAQRFKRIKRKSDLIFRTGGDEFVWIVEGLDAVNKPSFVNRINTALSMPIEYQGHLLAVTGSIGIATYPSDAASPDELLNQADQAMYHNKGS
ncbi:diguanylate cyclase (GGDEF) domain-containing protein [Vibrio xiamenensis]|uniref:Diguanylate cyclase (GGDEF) domain-containing protein n=1 Tax=Vibrio xiamenensis TaxID=861298 RepID=A0A1G8DR20_9VIBR|nr:GGDEF domain-containing protein [Vibrio xiamenensis]SDH60088.1 diguanylate cyclase (GGDEF) domain-containing protein [Vibrio xiamenensis]